MMVLVVEASLPILSYTILCHTILHTMNVEESTKTDGIGSQWSHDTPKACRLHSRSRCLWFSAGRPQVAEALAMTEAPTWTPKVLGSSLRFWTIVRQLLRSRHKYHQACHAEASSVRQAWRAGKNDPRNAGRSETTEPISPPQMPSKVAQLLCSRGHRTQNRQNVEGWRPETATGLPPSQVVLTAPTGAAVAA